jgi:Protein of unknown function (DUF2752)
MLPTLYTAPFDAPRARAERLVWLVLAGLALLLLALWSPADRPGPVLCALRLAAGVPCPFCGVTRGVGLCLRGRPVEATAFNPLTVPVLLAAAAAMATWTYEWLTGRQVRLRWPRRAAWLLLPLALVLLATWAYELGWRREDDFAASWLGRLLGLW